MNDETITRDVRKFENTLAIFLALGNRTRMKIVALLMDGELNVGELASLLDLKEPTVSHHLSRLRPTGIVNLRLEGNQHFYRLNKNALQSMGQDIMSLDAFSFESGTVKSEYSWLNELNVDDFAYETLRNYTLNQRLTDIPRKQAKLIVVLEWLVRLFEKDRIYSESEVNEILKQRHDDYARLRRDLVDMKYLHRDSSGSEYVYKGASLEHFK